jgi:hypothetical protein
MTRYWLNELRPSSLTTIGPPHAFIPSDDREEDRDFQSRDVFPEPEPEPEPEPAPGL